jgi:lipopolysaccharide biosynthesis glycosyltransferase
MTSERNWRFPLILGVYQFSKYYVKPEKISIKSAAFHPKRFISRIEFYILGNTLREKHFSGMLKSLLYPTNIYEAF